MIKFLANALPVIVTVIIGVCLALLIGFMATGCSIEDPWTDTLYLESLNVGDSESVNTSTEIFYINGTMMLPPAYAEWYTSGTINVTCNASTWYKVTE